MQITAIGLDLAKNVLQVRAIEAERTERAGPVFTFALPGSQMPPDDNAASLAL